MRPCGRGRDCGLATPALFASCARVDVNTPEPSSPRARWFAEEVLPHEPAVRGYLRSRFPRLDVDDVVQESYLKLFTARAAGKIASTRAYFFAVARNTAVSAFRRQRIYAPTPVNELPDWRVLDGGPDAAELANTRHQIDLVAAAIGALPGRCREIVTLAAVDGLTYSEIAARLGLSEATVRVQIARGVHKIAEYRRVRGEGP
jgi:RNA polymerase sigma-70 factor (ECF subfamily)